MRAIRKKSLIPPYLIGKMRSLFGDGGLLMKKASVLVLGSLLALTSAARAQFVGGGAPTGTAYQVYSVPGAAHAAGLSTIFSCTNPTGTSANVAVQLFDANGALLNASPALAVAPGATVQFATGATAPFGPDQTLNPVTGFTKGSAKIWSSGRSLLCTAILAGTWAGNTFWAPLTIAAKLKQKGD
ncbi:hypothetical protein L6Q96_10690 [Candidatus Binatia bacterium]|nr:hypothetical protein [Candidatus Binatia bacterium]